MEKINDYDKENYKVHFIFATSVQCPQDCPGFCMAGRTVICWWLPTYLCRSLMMSAEVCTLPSTVRSLWKVATVREIVIIGVIIQIRRGEVEVIVIIIIIIIMCLCFKRRSQSQKYQYLQLVSNSSNNTSIVSLRIESLSDSSQNPLLPQRFKKKKAETHHDKITNSSDNPGQKW